MLLIIHQGIFPGSLLNRIRAYLMNRSLGPSECYVAELSPAALVIRELQRKGPYYAVL